MKFITYFFRANSSTGVVVKSILLLCAVGLLADGGESWMNFWGIVIPVVLFIHGLMPSDKEYEVIKKAADDFLTENGIENPLVLGNKSDKALIDQKAKKIVFPEKRLVYDFADIKTWKWQWVEKNARKFDNVIAFELRDMENPIIKVKLSNAKEGEEWHSRLDLILNE